MEKCFYYINSFKRHRALAHVNRIEGNRENANYHDLKSYQFIDTLELGMRAIQKNVRSLEDVVDGNDASTQ